MVFISYSHKDELAMELLLSHLGVLKERGLIRVWTDKDIQIGGSWNSDIQTKVDQAEIAILLLSPDYLASEYICGTELPRLRQRAGLRILPLLVRDCDWRSLDWLAEKQIKPVKPLGAMNKAESDEALAELTRAVRSMVEQDEAKASPSLRFLVTAGVLGLAVLTAGYALLPRDAGTPSPPPPRKGSRIAVLDVRERSCGPDAAWLRVAFGDILTEALRTESGLQVVERQHIAEAGKDRALLGNKEPADFWRYLGADYVVVSSCFQKDGSREVEIHPLLVGSSGSSGRVLSPVQGLPAHVFDLAMAAARNLRQALGAPDLSPGARLGLERALPRDREAMRLYFDGLSSLRAGDAGRALERFDAIPEKERGPLVDWARARALWLLDEAQQANAALASARREEALLSAEARYEIEAMSHQLEDRWAQAGLEYGRLFELCPERYELALSHARMQALSGHLNIALSRLASLYRDDRPLRARAEIAHAIADLAHDHNDNPSALAWAAEARAKADEAGAVFTRAKAEMLLAQIRSSLGDHERARRLLGSACEDFRRLKADSYLYACREQQAIEGFHTGDTSLTEQIRREYEAASGEFGLGRILLLESAVATERGELTKARALLDQAIAAFRMAKAGWGVMAEMSIAGSFAERALVLFMAGKLAEARASAGQALATAAGNSEIEALARGVRAEAAYHLGLLDEAEEDQRKVLNLDRESTRLADMAYDSFKLGTILALRGDPGARLLLESGVYRQTKRFFRAEASIGLADFEIAEEHPRKALQLASDAEEILRPGNRTDMAMLARLAIVRALLAREEWQEARRALEREVSTLGTAQDFRVAHERDIATARILARAGEPTKAVSMLQGLIARASQEGHRLYELEARIAMVEVLGQGDRGHAEQARLILEETARAAAEMGARQIERRARRATVPG